MHSAAHLKKIKITDHLSIDWMRVLILIIDKILFLKVLDMEELNRELRRLTGKKQDLQWNRDCFLRRFLPATSSQEI